MFETKQACYDLLLWHLCCILLHLLNLLLFNNFHLQVFQTDLEVNPYTSL